MHSCYTFLCPLLLLALALIIGGGPATSSPIDQKQQQQLLDDGAAAVPTTTPPSVDGSPEIARERGNGKTIVEGVPPGFEKVLPQETIDKLKALHSNTNLTFPQKRREFDRIMNSVPKSILIKLPLPPGFETLPVGVQEQVRQVHLDSTLNWNEKHRKIGKIISSLPTDQRLHLPSRPASLLRGAHRPNFPPAPPPGFESVLPPEVYTELLKIHQDDLLVPKEKIQKIDAIMRSLPQDVLDRLPLPPGFDRLPEDLVKKARSIFANKELDYDEKNKAVMRFVKTELTPEQRQLVRPPLPPVLNQLPQETKDAIDEIFENENLNDEQRHQEFWKLIGTLPEHQRTKIQEDLGEDRP